MDKNEVLKDLCSIAETLDNNAELEIKVIASESELDVVSQMFQDYINITNITEEELTTGRYCELETRYSEAQKAADNITIHENSTALVKFKSGMEVTVGIK